MQTETITLTLNNISPDTAGKVLTFVEKNLAERAESTLTKPKTKPKTAAPAVVEESLIDETVETETETLDFMADDPTPEPAKTAPKKAKVTDKQVNEACVAYAKKNGRPKTLAVLEKKFGVKSITELDPKQYEAAIAALKV